MTNRVRCLLVYAAVVGCVVVPALRPRAVAAQNHSSPQANAPTDSLSLEAALGRFHEAWGLAVSYAPPLLAEQWTYWTQPQHEDPEDDLRALLDGKNLSFYRDPSSGTYAIVAAESPDRIYGSLGGHVLDQTTGLPLHRAHVLLALTNPTEQGAATNARGLFNIATLLPGEYIVLISHVGYQTESRIVTIRAGGHTELFVDLKIKPQALMPIIVDSRQGMDTPQALSATLRGDDLNRIKGLGTTDPVHILNDLPGVRVGDTKADVHIQGGDPGEHQFLLDGGLIFEPVHLGFVGATSPFAIERITVDKAGFSASKGSHLAGVINAEHALTDNDQHPLDVQVDPLSFNGRFNVSAGSHESVRADFMTTIRVSDWNGPLSNIRSGQIDNLLLAWNDPDVFLLRASLFPLRAVRPDRYNEFIQRLDSLPPPGIPELGFSDLHVAGRLHFPNGNNYHASYYRGTNRLRGRRLVTAFDSTARDLPNPDRYDWTNENAQVRWSFVPASNVFAMMRVRSSFYRLDHEYSGLDRRNATSLPAAFGRLFIRLTPADDGNRIRELALETTVDYDHPGGYLQTGLAVTRSQHRFTISDVFPRSITDAASSWRATFFAEEVMDLGPRFTITGGTRLTYLGARATFYAEPRLEARYTPFSAVSLRAAGGLYRQYLNQFDISTISPSTLFPSIRFWMPVDSSIAPPRAYHVAGDVVLRLAEGWTLRAEGYYKDQPRLLRIDYPSLWQTTEEEEAIPITSQAEFIESAKGHAYGSAFVLARAGTTLRTSLRYEYNVAERDYAFRDSVRLEPVPWTEPHRLEAALDWTPAPRLIVTARWRGGWGRIWGFRQAYYDYLGTDVAQALSFDDFDFQTPTDHTLPAFQQLDLGAAYTQPLGAAALQLRVDLLNATNENNVADRSLVEVPQGDDVILVPHERFLLSRTLSVSARLKW